MYMYISHACKRVCRCMTFFTDVAPWWIASAALISLLRLVFFFIVLEHMFACGSMLVFRLEELNDADMLPALRHFGTETWDTVGAWAKYMHIERISQALLFFFFGGGREGRGGRK